ncbi:helix-turn-helix domain-containing protein [Selenomonas ruminantium]|uniref:Helix-turn-helix domain-containing protein n=1 Tax=Selenomonas ruminantium TaxID=971 RepID=A0A1H3Z3F9_SELRU|nr:helix-turn-helix transcriptional regulator [Selenomonas ruminantium]SEA18235.1 Helix-turn-helix domain-containing protein [Selenomonas ruminantium]
MTGKEPKVAAQSLKINGTFAKQLKALREDKGLSQSVMARELNIPPATYANWEQGRALPSLGQIPFLAEFFNVSADYLLGISKQEAAERLLGRMNNLSPRGKKIVTDLIDEMLAK